MTTSGLYSDTNEAFNKSMEFYGGIENWIKLFVSKTSKEINEQAKSINDKAKNTTL